MPTLRITAFGGIAPRMANRLLPDNGAQLAENVKLHSGHLKPVNKPRIVYSPNKPMPPQSIYRARTQVSAGWMTWPFDVDVVRAPLPAEAESRYYWTGDGKPKMAKHTQAISGGNDDYPKQFFDLGIPAPEGKPTVTPTGGTGSTITRFYLVTFFSGNGEESAPSPVSASTSGRVDGTWTISDIPPLPELPWNITGMKRRLYRTTGTQGTWQLVHDDVGDNYVDNLSDAALMGDELISEGWLPPPAGLRGLCVHASGALVGFVGNQVCFSVPLQPHAWPESYRLSTDYPIVALATFGSEVAVATTGNPYIASGVEPGAMTMQKLDGLYPCVAKRSMVSVGDGALYASNHGLLYIGASGLRVFTETYFTRDEWFPLNPASMVCEYANGRIYCAYNTAAGEAAILVFDGGTLTTISLAVSEMYADQSTGELFLGLTDGVYLFDPAERSYPMRGAWRSKDFVFPTPCNLGAAKIDYKVAIDPVVQQQLLDERGALTALNEQLLTKGGFFGAMNFAAYNVRAVNGSEAYFVPPIPPSNDVQFVLRNADRVVFQHVVEDSRAFRLPAGERYDNVSIEMSGQGVVYEVRVAETMEGLKQA